jgi:hypothetical protein
MICLKGYDIGTKFKIAIIASVQKINGMAVEHKLKTTCQLTLTTTVIFQCVVQAFEMSLSEFCLILYG